MILRSSGVAAFVGSELRYPVFGTENRISSVYFNNSADDNFPVSNLLTPLTHQRYWSNSETVAIEIDFTLSGDLVNYVAFALHNFAGQSINIFAGRSTDSPTGLFEIFTTQAIPDNKPLICEFPADNYTQISVRIIGDGSSRAISAAVAYAGELLRMPRSVKVDTDQVPINFGSKNELLSGMSESGNFLGRLVRNQMFESKMEFSFIRPSDLSAREIDDWILNVMPTTPFFVAWAPYDFPAQTGFVWTTADVPIPQNMPTERYSVSIPIRGFA